MDSDNHPSNRALWIAPVETSAPVGSRAHKRCATGLDVYPTLSEKRLQIYKRRRRLTSRPSQRELAGVSQPTRFVSDDGAFEVVLQAIPQGLYIDYRRRKPDDVLIEIHAIVRNDEEFNRWCDGDPMSAGHRGLGDRMRKLGHELLAGRR